jgi:pimeloyl-ACP methyl ester carboxylesterase
MRQSVPVVEVFALSDGRQLAWAESGAADGRPVVYLHGAPGSIVEGARSPYHAQYASAGVRLISMERAGYGISTALPGRRFIDIVPDMGALADHLGLDNFAVVGWSAGGPHAFAAACGLADRVAAVGAVASIAPLDQVGLDGLGERVFVEMAQNDPQALRKTMKQLAASIRSDPEDTSTALLGDVMSERDVAYFARPENYDTLIADLVESARGNWEGFADDCVADAGDWGFDLDDVSVRVALFHGTADRVIPIEHSRFLAQAVPNASLSQVDGEGHFSVLDHLPQLCAELTTP